MQYKKFLSALIAGCSSVPSDSEIEKALEEGTITVADATSRGWIADAWIKDHFDPIEAKSKLYLFAPFETTYLDGSPASFEPIEGTMCLVFFDTTSEGTTGCRN